MWGIGTAVLFAGIQALQHHGVSAAQMIRYLGMFMIGGIFWGAAMWRIGTKTRASGRNGA
ncbi:hypothetical protein [Paraburkholderia acidisoli]|uniref:Uncharacterized protein n=1 Tax=Paraburkholderia acidisoli TaxID=2571748 RepID=A0A7Z2GMK4_9BURK|nr:hypothetical protein [Paraburkholderia acidisoli]QGZ64578.1 hypothetical protein FAZ98_22310 [Paraburkholderia acidisoli]